MAEVKEVEDQGMVNNPQWTLESSNYINQTDAEIDIKAFAMFYVHILWPDSSRDEWNLTRYLIDHASGRHVTDHYSWNIPREDDNYMKWFPYTIFPNGINYNKKSIELSIRLRCCLDNLVVDCFFKPDLVLNKSNKFGLGFFSLNNNVTMESVSQNVKGILLLLK